MSDKTGIEWTDATWNPVTGCTKVSQGCKHCYAEREWPRMTRLVPAYAGRDFTDVQIHADRLDQPLHWKRPRRIFVNSMSDLFHDEVPFDLIAKVFDVMARCPQHYFQILTKRPRRMQFLLQSELNLKPLPNVWLGVSIEDQATADERLPLLLETPASVHWISAEPLLAPIDLKRIKLLEDDGDDFGGWDHCDAIAQWVNSLDGKVFSAERRGVHLKGVEHSFTQAKIDWVVAGGESGPNARPMHPDWARDLRDQCSAAGVPFLFKQWGEWFPEDSGETAHSDIAGVLPSGDCAYYSQGYTAPFDEQKRLESAGNVRLDGRTLMNRIGKKRAGRLLDGVQHDGYPEVQR